MANEDSLDRSVTEFLLNTTQFTKLSRGKLQLCAIRSMGMKYNFDFGESFTSGSLAEFYIKPPMPYIGDIDTMLCYNWNIAIPSGYAIPTQLSAHFQRALDVHEIIGSHKPGFVYLKRSFIAKTDEDGRVTAVEKVQAKEVLQFLPRPLAEYPLKSQEHLPQAYMQLYPEIWTLLKNHPQHRAVMNMVAHGPTVELAGDNLTVKRGADLGLNFNFNCDLVNCVRCLVWPQQAADWPTRLRSHGVPEQSVIDTVVRNGCDLVAAVHPLCRQDEWMTRYQWRLSFSRAEVTLLNNWTPVQQIIYHMLRFVMKHKVLSETDNKDLPHLCNYHIKTLMLWECEQKAQRWWSTEFSLVNLCSFLLHKLSEWVENKLCQQYFISDCNLLDHFTEEASQTTCLKLRHAADPSTLLKWFIYNYIVKCCPDKLLAHFEDSRSTDDLQKAIHAVLDWKLTTLPIDQFMEHFLHQNVLISQLQITGRDAFDTLMFTKDVQDNFDGNIVCIFYTAVATLRVSHTLSNYPMTEDILEVLWILHNPLLTDRDIRCRESGERLCISKAIALVTLSSVRSDALEMLHNEMAKALLHQSLAYGQVSTYSVVHVLLAALYYKSGHYQAAIDHCKQVMNQSAVEQLGSRCIGAEYLPQIDENVDAVFGLILLYQHLQENARTCGSGLTSEAVRLPVFTAHLLACYLCSQCPRAAITEVNNVMSYRKHLLQTKSPLLSDILLFKSTETQSGEDTKALAAGNEADDVGNVSNSMDTTLLVTSLELVALETLTSVRQTMVRDIQHPVVNEYEALYAYKCGMFEDCLQLCGNEIRKLFRDRDLRNHNFLLYPELLSLLDGELVSVVGLVQLIQPLSVLEISSDTLDMMSLLLYLRVRCHQNGFNDSVCETLHWIRSVHDRAATKHRIFFLSKQILSFIDCLLKRHILRQTAIYRLYPH